MNNNIITKLILQNLVQRLIIIKIYLIIFKLIYKFIGMNVYVLWDEFQILLYYIKVFIRLLFDQVCLGFEKNLYPIDDMEYI